MKLIKNKKEICALYQSANLAVECMKFISTKLVRGVTEKQLSNKVRSWFKRHNVLKLAFPTIVAFGPNGANPHHKPTNKALTDKDVVVIDMGCVYNGQCSDITRTFLPIKHTKKQLEIYKLVLQANKTAIEQTKAGMKANEVDKICRDIITKAGYGKYFVHTTGHGIGKLVHEQPKIGMNDETILKNNMFFTIEPGIYIPGKFGVRIEDTVCLLNSKIDVLTKSMAK